MCSSNQSLEIMVKEGKFSGTLFKELRKTALVMPPLSTLAQHELDELTYGYAQQALTDKTYEKILDLQNQFNKKNVQSTPASLQDLKRQVHTLLINKSKTKQIEIEQSLNPSYQISNPELSHIARLGKHALHDEKIMNILWNHFRNQSRIANFLGVNRSSVNRRCKIYNLHDKNF